MDKMLELLRVQRHNFANHLQVISGLLQLKKYEKAFGYIKLVGDELNQISIVARLEKPELVKIIFCAELLASKRGIKIEHSIDANLQKFSGSDKLLADVINEIFEFAINFVRVDIQSENIVKFILSDSEDCIFFEFCLPLKNNELFSLDNDKLYEQIEAKATSAGWQMTMASGRDHAIITLAVPCSDTKVS